MAVYSDLRKFLFALNREEIEKAASWFGISYSRVSIGELTDAICSETARSLDVFVCGSGPFSLDDLNAVSARLGGLRRASLVDAVNEIIRRDALENTLWNSKSGLREVVADKKNRSESLRKYLRELHPVDRKLFFRLARNQQGGGAITDPERNGFLRISTASNEDLIQSLSGAWAFDDQDTFEKAIALTHRVSHNYRVYIGRTFVRAGERHVGLRNRWTSHANEKRMTHGRALALIPRSKVERAELVAIRLVSLWSDYGVLCCNNECVDRTPSVAPDLRHVIYMCIGPR